MLTFKIFAFISSGEQDGSPAIIWAISSGLKFRCLRVTCQGSWGILELACCLSIWSVGVNSSLRFVDTESMTSGIFLVCSNRASFKQIRNHRKSNSLIHYHTMPHFDALKIYSCGKYCEKRINCFDKQFLLFSQCFLPYMVLIFHFKCTLKCCLQFVSIWTSQKFFRLVMG